jgi:hypothetical protein
MLDRTNARRAALALLIALLAALAIAPPRRMTRKMPDLEVYWRAGVRARAAEPLYRPEDGHYQFKYLPAFAVLATPAAWIPLPRAKAVWLAISAGCLVLLLALSVAALPGRRRRPWVLVVGTVIVMGKFYGHEITLGQVNLAFAVVVTAAIVLLRRRHDAAAGGLVALAIVIKPYAVLFVPWLAVRGRVRALASALAGLAAALVLPVPLYRVHGTLALHEAWWRTVTGSTAPNLLNQDNVSLAALFAKWLGAGALASGLAAAAGLILIGVGAWIVVKRRPVAEPDPLEAGALLVLIPLLSPQGWDYVFLIATPAVMLVIDRLDQVPAVLRAAAAVALPLIGLSVYDVLGRRLYAEFMALSIITLCFVAILGALAGLRARQAA